MSHNVVMLCLQWKTLHHHWLTMEAFLLQLSVYVMTLHKVYAIEKRYECKKMNAGKGMDYSPPGHLACKWNISRKTCQNKVSDDIFCVICTLLYWNSFLPPLTGVITVRIVLNTYSGFKRYLIYLYGLGDSQCI